MPQMSTNQLSWFWRMDSDKINIIKQQVALQLIMQSIVLVFSFS